MEVLTSPPETTDSTILNGETVAENPQTPGKTTIRLEKADAPLETLASRLAEHYSTKDHDFRFNGGLRIVKPRDRWKSFRIRLGIDKVADRTAVNVDYENGTVAVTEDYLPSTSTIDGIVDALESSATLEDFPGSGDNAKDTLYMLVNVMKGRNSNWCYLKDEFANHLDIDVDWNELEETLGKTRKRDYRKVDSEMGLEDMTPEQEQRLYDVATVAGYVLTAPEKFVPSENGTLHGGVETAARWLKQGYEMSELPGLFRQDGRHVAEYAKKITKPALQD